MKSLLVALLAAAGCASGGNSLGQSDAAPTVDAKQVDAAPPQPDAFVPADAFVPPIDTFVPQDAAPDAAADAAPDACVPMASQLLANPVFDLTPVGTGWQQTPIDPAYPLITDQDGATEHTAPYKAWLGGIVAPSSTVTDVLYQDVTIPANTTSLVFTGYYAVGTQESATETVAYDTGSIAFTQTNGTPIVTLNSFSNLTPTTQWVAINYTFPQDMSGQTIRLRMTSSNDFLNVTNFYFDTFGLNATHCP